MVRQGYIGEVHETITGLDCTDVTSPEYVSTMDLAWLCTPVSPSSLSSSPLASSLLLSNLESVLVMTKARMWMVSLS